jgi:nicotinamidase/pyrazinamidase
MTEIKDIIFWDVDTQVDFMNPEGKLYVPGAELLKDNLGKLTQYARMNNIRILGTVDYHSDSDPEIEEENPDYEKTFPPHCMQNEPGQEKIMETRSDLTNWIDSDSYPEEEIKNTINSKGPIIFRKSSYDSFSNPNTFTFIGEIKPKKVAVYGVAIDYCVKSAIEGLMNFGELDIYLVVDAIEGIKEEESIKLVEEWVQKGVRTVTTEGVLQGALLE